MLLWKAADQRDPPIQARNIANFGWNIEGSTITPVVSTAPVAPQALLDVGKKTKDRKELVLLLVFLSLIDISGMYHGDKVTFTQTTDGPVQLQFGYQIGELEKRGNRREDGSTIMQSLTVIGRRELLIERSGYLKGRPLLISGSGDDSGDDPGDDAGDDSGDDSGDDHDDHDSGLIKEEPEQPFDAYHAPPKYADCFGKPMLPPPENYPCNMHQYPPIKQESRDVYDFVDESQHQLQAVKKRGRKKKSELLRPGEIKSENYEIKKPRKKFNRFNGMPEEEVLLRKLPDHLAPNLDIVIIGINPGLFAAYKGHHYAGPGNHFWKCLYLSGLIPQQLTAADDHRLLEFGIGFTNIVARASRGSADLTKSEIKEGAEILMKKLIKYRPNVAVFNGKGIYEIFCGKKDFCFGWQPEPLEGSSTTVFVMPSSSARCAQLPRAADKVPFYKALKKVRDHLRGDIADLDPNEVVFPDVKLGFDDGKREFKDASPNEYNGLDGIGSQLKQEGIDGEYMEKPKRKRGRPKKKREPELSPVGNGGTVVPVGGNQSMYNMMRPESIPSGGHWNNYECNSNQQSSSTATSQSQYFMPNMSQDQYYPHGNQMNSGNNPQNQYYMQNNMFSGPATSSSGSNPGTSNESGQYYVNEMYPPIAGNPYYGQNSTQSQLNGDFRMNYMTNPSCPNDSQSHPDSYSHNQPTVENYNSGSNQSKPEGYNMESMQAESVNYSTNNDQTDYNSSVKQEANNYSPNQPNTGDYNASVGHPSPANYNQAVLSQPIPNNYRPGDENFSSQDVSKTFPAGPVANNDVYQHQERSFSSTPSSNNIYRHPEQSINNRSNLESEPFGISKQFNPGPGPGQTDVFMHQQGNKTFASVSDIENFGNQDRTKDFNPNNAYPPSEAYPNIHDTESFSAKMTPPSAGNYNIGSESPATNTFPNGNNQVCDKFNSSNGQSVPENFQTNPASHVSQQSFGDSSNSAPGNLPAINNTLVTENYNSPLSDQSGCKSAKTPIPENDLNNFERQAMKPVTNLSDQSVISAVSPLCQSPMVSNNGSPFPVNLTTSGPVQSPSSPVNELVQSNSTDCEKKETDSMESVPSVTENNECRIESVEKGKDSPAASLNSEDNTSNTLDLSLTKEDVEKKEIFEKDISESNPQSNEQSKPVSSDQIDSPTEPILSVGNSSSVSSCVPQQDSISSPKSQLSVGTNPGSIYSEASPLSQNTQNTQRPAFKNAQSPPGCQPVQSGNNFVDDQSIVSQGTENAQGQHPLYPPANQSPANNSSSQPPLYHNDQSAPNNQLVPSNHFSNSPAPSASPDQSSVYPQYSTSYPSSSRFSAFSPSASLSSTSLTALSSYVSAWTSNSNFAGSQPPVPQPRAFAAASMSTNLGTSLHAAAAHSGMSIQALEASLSSQSSVQSLGSSSSMHALGTSMSSNASVQSLGSSNGGFQSLHATAALASNLGVSASAAASMQSFGMMPGQPGFSATMSAGRSWTNPDTFGSSLQRAQGQMTAPHMISPWNMYNSYSHGYNQSYRGGYSLPEQGEVTYSQHFHMKQEPRGGYYGEGEY
ncbi:G/T mismatch-specific thymine DNA glycosylase [Nymphon striatum]|nr:G/T mismatch-specific thymine DNA glycosylase [Nymphon striatum]